MGLRGELPMTALCERYGISRDTGYRLLAAIRQLPLPEQTKKYTGTFSFNRHG
jgi:hypothetical protein